MSRILPRYTDTRTEDEAKLARILLETGEPAPPPPTTLKEELTKPGDPRKLRGIPAIGRNVRGAIPGSIPGEELWR